MKVELETITWLGNTKDEVLSWPETTRKRAGAELYRLQIRGDPLHWRSMKSIGRGVREIKISEGGQHRIFYLVRKASGIYVLHAFVKKTQRTSKSDIDLCKERLKLIR